MATKFNTYSLWLIPSGDVYDRLSSLIKSLSARYNAPLFEPHVTLLGDIVGLEKDISKRTKKLFSDQKPFPIILSDLSYNDFYYKSLFIKVIKTQLLQKSHDRTKKAFNTKGVSAYMPHMSLLYGTLPTVIKKHIIQSVGIEQHLRFTASSIHIFKTDGEVGSWCRMKEVPFIKPSP